MKSTLFLCGAGNAEGVRLALRINEKESRWEKIVILDDDQDKKGKSILNVNIEGSFELLKHADPKNTEVANLVARTTTKRFAAYKKIMEYGLPFATLIDPNVDTWGVEYNGDITIYQNVTFSAGAFIDEGSVVLTGAVVGHGCKVGKYCVIAPGAVLNARVELKDGVYMGTNASILPDLKVGAWATIGINSAIVQNIPDGATAMGVPAEILMMTNGKANGTTNRKVVLPQATAKRPKLDSTFIEPKSEIEKSLVEIWTQVLKVEKVGIDDSFFDLGGHSLSAVQVVFQIQKKLNVNIPLQSFFDKPTISGLSKKIESELVGSTSGANLEKLLDEIEGVSR
jgi:sugar O-acyltransferase (sialic acid O-acetyltransferase NeuD family)